MKIVLLEYRSRSINKCFGITLQVLEVYRVVQHSTRVYTTTGLFRTVMLANNELLRNYSMSENNLKNGLIGLDHLFPDQIKF